MFTQNPSSQIIQIGKDTINMQKPKEWQQSLFSFGLWASVVVYVLWLICLVEKAKESSEHLVVSLDLGI